jgi:predicted transcriptional regulator
MMIRGSTELAENKLLLLYLLYKIDFPLTNAQITQCIMEKNWMNYFDLQQYLSELTQAGLIDYIKNKQKYFYCITDRGRRTLEYFFKRIPASLRESVEQYALDNRSKLRKETQFISSYKKVRDKEYAVNCKVVEGDFILIDLTLNVVSSSQAKQICNNWKNKATEIYKGLMNTLIEKN